MLDIRNMRYRFGRVILSEAVRRSRRISLVFSLLFLILITACTDYVSKIDNQIAELTVNESIVYSSAVISSSSSDAQSIVDPSTVVIGSITDSRDGQSYKTVVIGKQTWMAQNLNYQTVNSSCHGGIPSNCTKYGRLYTWAVATSACPSGWHLPTRAEFETLITAVGGSDSAGKMLKSTSGWSNNRNGSDAYSFSALPAGYGDSMGYYGGEGGYANFWSSTGAYDDAANMYLRYSHSNADLSYDKKYLGYSVRCVKD